MKMILDGLFAAGKRKVPGDGRKAVGIGIPRGPLRSQGAVKASTGYFRHVRPWRTAVHDPGGGAQR